MEDSDESGAKLYGATHLERMARDILGAHIRVFACSNHKTHDMNKQSLLLYLSDPKIKGYTDFQPSVIGRAQVPEKVYKTQKLHMDTLMNQPLEPTQLRKYLSELAERGELKTDLAQAQKNCHEIRDSYAEMEEDVKRDVFWDHLIGIFDSFRC